MITIDDRATGKTTQALREAVAAMVDGARALYLVGSSSEAHYCFGVVVDLITRYLPDTAVVSKNARRFHYGRTGSLQIIVADEQLQDRLRGSAAKLIVDHAVTLSPHDRDLVQAFRDAWGTTAKRRGVVESVTAKCS